MEDKWVKIIRDDETINVTEAIPNFIIMEVRASYPVSTIENTSTKGVDGELPGVATFAPFNLIIKCGFDGFDSYDVTLMEWRLRDIFFSRKPFYIVTSENPGIKYPVQNPDIQPDYSDYTATKFEMTFSVYKGYAESINDTSDLNFLNDNWQFESGVITDEIKYNFNEKRFMVWNGSSDKIDPSLRHRLKLIIHADAPNGLRIKNYHNDSEFIYYESLSKGDTLVIDGVYPIKNNKRVGINTNNDWITLERGNNNIEIDGNGVSNVSAQFVFPFIFR